MANGDPERVGLSAAEAARLLGVKRETVYSYVSRGALTSTRRDGRRESLFDPVEVARLAEAKRGGTGRAGRLELVVDSGLTLLDPGGGLWYRGWEAAEAARTAWFESVALWLWGQDRPEGDQALSLFSASERQLAVGREAIGRAPASATPLDHYLLALAAAGGADPYRHGRDPRGVANRGARMIALLVDSLPALGRESTGTSQAEGSVAARLWRGLSPAPPSPLEVRALNAALVLLADHELATSTMAARLAASTWADIYRVVIAGMATLGGPLHGSVGDRTVPMLKEAASVGVEQAVGSRLRSGESLPGFGHLVYRDQDPRGDELLSQVRSAFPQSPVVAAADELIGVVRAETPGAFANVDLAVAVLVGAAGMIEGAAEAIFATARTAGWIAHGIEEYAYRLRFRTRAAYTGPLPG